MSRLQVTAKEAGEILSLSSTTIYELAAQGLLVKNYIGKGTRNFRITVESIERYQQGLSQDPIAESA